jgi:hypothetical protein
MVTSDNGNRVSTQHYVLIVSQHNAAGLLACCHFKPQFIYLIATKYFNKQADKLKLVLKEVCPESHITLLDTSHLSGESYINAIEWARHHLVDIAKQEGAVLNVTGGTKVMCLAFEKALAWHELHYQAFNSDSLEVIIPQGREIISRNIDVNVSHSLISVKNVCQLYIENIQGESAQNFTVSTKHYQVAEEIWSCLDTDQHPHRALAKSLVQNNRYKGLQKGKPLRLCWDEFEKEGINKQDMISWLKVIKQCCPELFAIDLSGITFFPNSNSNSNSNSKQASSQFKWLAGGWLEDLIANWLKELESVLPQHIATNVSFNRSKAKESGREVDVMLYHRQKLNIIETKAGINVKGLTDAERQVSSLKDAFPAANKFLVFGPWAKESLASDMRLDEFRAQCKSAGVNLITTKAELIKALQ